MFAIKKAFKKLEIYPGNKCEQPHKYSFRKIVIFILSLNFLRTDFMKK